MHPYYQTSNKIQIIHRIVYCIWIYICYDSIIVIWQPLTLTWNRKHFIYFFSQPNSRLFQTLLNLSKFKTFPQSWKIFLRTFQIFNTTWEPCLKERKSFAQNFQDIKTLTLAIWTEMLQTLPNIFGEK